MESRSETFAAPPSGSVEIGTITMGGREFSALGATISPDGDRVAGYPHFPDGESIGIAGDGRRVHPRGEMRNWNGETIGSCRIVAAWKTPRSWVSSTMYQIEATIDGRKYTGRGAGSGMLWRGRLKAGAK